MLQRLTNQCPKAVRRAYATLPNPRTFPTSTTSPPSVTGKGKGKLDVQKAAPTLHPLSPSPSLPPTSDTLPPPAPDSTALSNLSDVNTDVSASEPTAELTKTEGWNWPSHVVSNEVTTDTERPQLGIPVNPRHGLWHFFRFVSFCFNRRRNSLSTD